MTKTMMNYDHANKKLWDGNSGIRERLALLATYGHDLTPSSWGYNPSRDTWYFCGESNKSLRGEVRQEGEASLALILNRWGIDRATAMSMIGYPEAGK